MINRYTRRQEQLIREDTRHDPIDGVEYRVLPDVDYFNAQLDVIVLLADHLGIGREQAANVYVERHAKYFNQWWFQSPEMRGDIVPIYMAQITGGFPYIEDGTRRRV